jgi:predicted TIM-barrel fold metal-dependent hydrolase
MNTAQASKSRKLRERLSHPVIDSDGHTWEFEPAVLDKLKEIGGADLVSRYRGARHNGMAAGLNNRNAWHSMTPEQRFEHRVTVPAWWTAPTRNTLDRATAMLPRLLSERLDDLGLDLTILYPSLGLLAPTIGDAEMRRAACRAFNCYNSEAFRAHADRIIPAAVIPMHTPEEAIDELEYAVRTLGMKVAMLATHVLRPVPAVERLSPEAARYAYWLDVFALDSLYDYDPVWAKCVELKIAPSFHTGGMGWGGRSSISTYMYNHIGHFAESGEALCKALFFGGVVRRFPQLRFAFLEGGVATGTRIYSDLVARWDKRNPETLQNYNPANLDMPLFLDLCRKYGGDLTASRLDEIERTLGGTGYTQQSPPIQNDFARAGISRPEDVRDRFIPHFYFGCEADDPMNASAFNTRVNPFGEKVRAVFSSDIGHWDVPDMTEVTEEAHELVERGLITEEDFRDFVFTNPVSLWAGVNPEFFNGTRVEHAVRKVLQSG